MMSVLAFGRLQKGADADIVIFDPKTIAANETYGDPYNKPTGMLHVIVGGRQIVKDSERIEGRYPARLKPAIDLATQCRLLSTISIP